MLQIYKPYGSFNISKATEYLCFITFHETHGMNMAFEKIHKKTTCSSILYYTISNTKCKNAIIHAKVIKTRTCKQNKGSSNSNPKSFFNVF
mgnify:FL=1